MTREEEIKQAANKYAAKEYRHQCEEDKKLASADFAAGAEWADAHNPQIAYLVHDIERLKSKLQAANDLNTLLTAELEKAKSPWISVEERLPEKYKLVLVKAGRGGFYLAEKDSVAQPRDEFAIPQLSSYVNGITHWMPMPINN